MTEGRPQGPLAALHKELRTGKITRREFTLRALALGVGMPIISFILRAETVEAQRGPAHRLGRGCPGASGPPAEGMDGRTRGEGGELKMIQWQAPSMLSPHVSTGNKDYLAAQLIIEPLMHYLPDGTLIPNLVTEVPTVENGLLAEDLKSVTYKLLGRGHLGRRRAVDRRRRRLHLGVDHRSGQRRQSPRASTRRSSRWRSSIR